MQPAILLLAVGAAGGAIGLAVLAGALLAQGAEERDLATRLRLLLRPAAPAGGEKRVKARGLLRPVVRLGETLRDSALISAKEVARFQRAITAAGLDPRHAVPLFIGAKALLLLTLPAAAVAAVLLLELERPDAAKLLLGALVLAVLAPNWLVTWLRRPHQNRLRQGLPDALDLLVVAAEAGLGLESALDRVAHEMAASNRAIAGELNTLVQELRMLPDRRMALERLAQRTELDGFKRLGTTLAQTLRYGTPLAQALRVLAADMRQDRMLRIEEKAIRLPALLIGPLILFILPALFIALIGPSILEIGKSFGGQP
jgi:tight adherence protein C